MNKLKKRRNLETRKQFIGNIKMKELILIAKNIF